MNSVVELYPRKEYPLYSASFEIDIANTVRDNVERQLRETLWRLRISPNSSLLDRLNFLTAIGFCSPQAAMGLIQQFHPRSDFVPERKYLLFNPMPKLTTNIITSLFFEASQIIGHNDPTIIFFHRDLVDERKGLLARGLAVQAKGESQRLLLTVPHIPEGQRRAELRWKTEKLY